MRVVILAAGLGTRLGGDCPKPMASISAGVTLLSNQVDILGKLVGRDRITLVLGYQAERIADAFPDLAHTINARYAQTNTAKSLLCAAEGVDDDLLWTNADLYFEMNAAQQLIDADSLGSRLLVNTAPVSDEEIKYSLHEDGSIAELSKAVANPIGESLGLQIVTQCELPLLVEQLRMVGDQDYFEKALENGTLSRTIRAMPVEIRDSYCREVDFPEDLEAVRRHLAGKATS